MNILYERLPPVVKDDDEEYLKRQTERHDEYRFETDIL